MSGKNQSLAAVSLAFVGSLGIFACGDSNPSHDSNNTNPTATTDAGRMPPTTDGTDAGRTTSMGGAGVVADATCYPLCASASSDPDGDNWGFENGASCVVRDSNEAKARLPCTVGQPLPSVPTGPPPGSAGVVVDNMCVRLCTVVLVDDNNDGYGWELEASCVIPGSATAKASLACKTGEAVPQPDFTGLPGRLLNGLCVPYCRTAAPDPDGDGFNFEFGASCVVPGSAPATTMGIDCKVGEDLLAPPAVLNPSPPPGTVQKPAAVASRGFFVQNGRLYDKFGNDFVMRGINNPHIYFDASNQYLAYQALDPIARYGANTIRIVWRTGGSAANLARVIRRVVELRMIPMVELHDVTGGTSNLGLLQMAAYYTSDEVKQVLLAYQDFLLVNIANEWSGLDFRNAYQAAILALRTAGIASTLVIDSNDFGQSSDTILADGRALLDADPQHNLVFSLHMYQEYAATTAGRAHITSALGQTTTAGLPLIVGEFGWQAGGAAVDSALIMSECVRLGVGYLAWSWKGNDASLAYLDMAVDWQGQTLTGWGTDVIQGDSGIAKTALRASIFLP